ncbi:MAG: hypothetical protein ABI612_10745 [Betaproteobacteria bacterium]
MKRVQRAWISAISMFVLLFAQLSVAVYACPAGNKLNAIGAAAAHAVTPCADVDPQRTALCKEHCKGQTAVDHVQLPGVPPAVDTGITLQLVDIYRVIAPRVARIDLTRVTEPPPAIRFCVFRT